MDDPSEIPHSIDTWEPADSTSTDPVGEGPSVPATGGPTGETPSVPTASRYSPVAETMANEPGEADGQGKSPNLEKRPTRSLARRASDVLRSELVRMVRAIAPSTTGDEPEGREIEFDDSEGHERGAVQASETAAGSLPDPITAGSTDLIPGLVTILESEGPMTGQSLHQSFVKAAGGQRVGSRARKNLDRAIRSALSKDLIEKRDELGTPGYREQIFRVAGSPHVNLRPRGNREFMEIPPSEVAYAMKQLRERMPSLAQDSLFRNVLDQFDTIRMTRNIQERLDFAHEQQDELAG